MAIIGNFMTVKETAKKLGVTPQTLHLWRKNGHGPVAVKLGSEKRPRYAYVPEDIDEWIRQQRETPR